MTAIQISTGRTERVARLYALALIAAVALTPQALILYLDRFQTPSLLFMDHAFHVIAIASQSSLTFVLARPWNHQWWLAHAIFASGFFVLSYGVVRALPTAAPVSAVDR